MLDGATGWTLFAGLLLTTGTVTTRWLVLPRIRSAPGSAAVELRSRIAGLGLLGAAVLVVGLGLFFLRQLLEFRDPLSPWRDETALLLSTAWGHRWIGAVGASALLVSAFAWTRRHAAGWWVASPLAAALAAFPALTGHAAASEPFPALFIAADALHVLAAGAWIGGLAAILWLERDARRSAGTSHLPALVPAFSPVAMAAVAILTTTGLLATWEHLPSLPSLFTTAWGRLLLFKLVVIAVVLALGARNFRVLTPRLGETAGNAAMRRSALLELTIAQIVLIATALLVRTSPM